MSARRNLGRIHLWFSIVAVAPWVVYSVWLWATSGTIDSEANRNGFVAFGIYFGAIIGAGTVLLLLAGNILIAVFGMVCNRR